jgi:hypothetical protein
MQSSRVALDSESFLKLNVTAEGLVFATIANTRNQGIIFSKPALLRLFSQMGLIAEACEIGATMQAQAQSRACLGSQQHPVDLTASDGDDEKENVDPGLPGIQQLRMRLLFSDSSETTADSPDQNQDDQEISTVDSASASHMQDEDKEISTIGSASEMQWTGDEDEGDMDYGTDDDEVFL